MLGTAVADPDEVDDLPDLPDLDERVDLRPR